MAIVISERENIREVIGLYAPDTGRSFPSNAN